MTTDQAGGMPPMGSYRVLFQYLGLAGPHFEFTTVLASSPEEAGKVIEAVRSRDIALSIVQVVEANDFTTGFDRADALAAAEEIRARGKVD